MQNAMNTSSVQNSPSIRAFYFVGEPIKTMTPAENSELRAFISKYFGPLDNLLRGYPIKDASNVKQLREVLDALEVDIGTPLSGGTLIDMGIRYNSIILFMYGKWISKSFGIITGDDCRQACMYGNIHMLKFISNTYPQFASKFICEKPNDWHVDPQQAEFWFHCYNGAYNAKYYEWARLLYKTMMKKPNVDANYYSIGIHFSEMCELGKLDEIKDFHMRNKRHITSNDLEYAMIIALKYKRKDICLFLQSVGAIGNVV